MKALSLLGAGLVGLLFFTWPIPHTIAARNLLMLLSLALLGYLAYKARPDWPHFVSRLRMPLLLCAAFTAWLVIGAVFASTETAWALGEIKGQWGKALLALAIGLLAAQLPGTAKNALFLLIFSALAIHVLYVDYAGLKGWWETGALAKRLPGLTEGPDKSNLLTNIFITLLLAEACYRAACRRRLLPFGGPVLIAFAAAAALSSYIEAVRNGMITLVILILAAAAIGIHANRGKTRLRMLLMGVLAIVVVIGAFARAYVQSDERWKGFAETLPIALDTETHKTWLDESKYPLPSLPEGRTLDASAYLRIAFLKEGALLVRDYPFGVGYGRNAFAHGLRLKYGEEGVGHSHSGLLDLAIGAGIPGALLWLGLMASLAGIAYRQLAMQPNYFALLLVLLLIDFNVRMLLDSINRDHAQEQFMFLLGWLAIMVHDKRRDSAMSGNAPEG